MLYFIINSVIFTVNLGILPKSTSILHGKAVAFSHLWVIILCETEKEKKQASRCSFFLRNHVIGMEFSILCLLLMSSLCITKDLGFFFRVIWHEPGGVVRGFAKRLGPHSQLTREDWPRRNADKHQYLLQASCHLLRTPAHETSYSIQPASLSEYDEYALPTKASHYTLMNSSNILTIVECNLSFLKKEIQRVHLITRNETLKPSQIIACENSCPSSLPARPARVAVFVG